MFMQPQYLITECRKLSSQSSSLFMGSHQWQNNRTEFHDNG